MIQKNINIIKMVQRKKFNYSNLISLMLVLIHLSSVSCSSKKTSDNKCDQLNESSTYDLEDNNLTSDKEKNEEGKDFDKTIRICLSNIVDEEVGLDTTWVGQADFNPTSNLVDTFWTITTDKIYRSIKLDRVLDVKNGLYVDYLYDYGYFEGNENFEIVNKVNTETDLAYALVLQENNSDCKELLDMLVYKRLYFISCAFESPGCGGKYVNYLAVGAYVNNDGTLYDKRKKGILFYEGSHDYRIDKVYGVSESGKLTMLGSKFGVPINPNLDKYYFNDTIVFNLPH